MPIYEYTCTKCDIVFDELKSVSDETPVTCKQCGDTAKKLPSAAAFRIRGFSAANAYSSKPPAKKEKQR